MEEERKFLEDRLKQSGMKLVNMYTSMPSMISGVPGGYGHMAAIYKDTNLFKRLFSNCLLATFNNQRGMLMNREEIFREREHFNVEILSDDLIYTEEIHKVFEEYSKKYKKGRRITVSTGSKFKSY